MRRLPSVGRTCLAAWAAASLVSLAASCSGGRSPAADYPWLTIDASYAPKNAVEEFLKADATAKGLLPFFIKNYDHNAAVLKKFRGKDFAGPTQSVLEMSFKGLDDWMLVDLRYTNEKERDVQRTILYIESAGQWRVGDSGRLMK